MKLDQQILKNMQAELNICKAKRSVMIKGGLVPSILTRRIEFLEAQIVVQNKKLAQDKNIG